MTAARAVHIVVEVAAALDYAHSRNIVHRDVKPANFLLSGTPGPEERVLLGDFGIARALDDFGLTATGSVVATFAYAAPEVLAGDPFDGRADIYSLGCTLYRLLTGKTPYPTTNGMAAVMMAHLTTAPPRPTASVPSLPPAFDEVIATAMAKQPEHRYRSAAALAAAATAAITNGQVSSTTAVPTPPGAEPPPAGPWWDQGRHGGARTRLAHPAASAPPPPSAAPSRPRRRTALLTAAATATVAVVTAGAIAVWPESSTTDAADSGTATESTGARAAAPTPRTAPTPGAAPTTAQHPANDIPPTALREILLPATELTALTGAALTLDSDTSDVTVDPSTVSDPQCVSGWSPAQPVSFEGDTAADRDTVTGAAVQTLRALHAQPWQDGIVQAAVTVTPPVAGFMLRQQRRWAACASAGSVTITAPQSPPRTWTFTPPVTTAGVLVMDLRTDGAACQRGAATRGNVIFDVRQCRTDGSNDVVALINALSERLPTG
jgi:serine/threonine-protein kinase